MQGCGLNFRLSAHTDQIGVHGEQAYTAAHTNLACLASGSPLSEVENGNITVHQ